MRYNILIYIISQEPLLHFEEGIAGPLALHWQREVTAVDTYFERSGLMLNWGASLYPAILSLRGVRRISNNRYLAGHASQNS